MKKLPIIILIFLLIGLSADAGIVHIPSIAEANMSLIVAGGGTPSGGEPPAGNTVSYDGVEYGATPNDVSIEINVPAATDDGDLMILSLVADREDSTWTATGWTSITSITSSSSLLEVFYRIASSEPASYTLTLSSGSQLGGSIHTYSKDGGTWTIQDSEEDAATNSSISTTSITFSQDNSMLHLAFGSDDDLTVSSGPADMTERAHVDGSSSELYTYTEARSSGAVTKSITASTSGDLSTIVVAIEAQ